jgi:hypothetical protein
MAGGLRSTSQTAARPSEYYDLINSTSWFVMPGPDQRDSRIGLSDAASRTATISKPWLQEIPCTHSRDASAS